MKSSDEIGIGVDIEQIDRFRKIIQQKKKSILEHIFTESELQYCFSKAEPEFHLAARFAAKEAVIKAMNCINITIPLKYNQIEILHTKTGAPDINVENKHLKDKQIRVSLSHCKTTAIAFVIII